MLVENRTGWCLTDKEPWEELSQMSQLTLTSEVQMTFSFHCYLPPACCTYKDIFFTEKDNTHLNRLEAGDGGDTKTQTKNAHNTTSIALVNGSTGSLEVCI